MSSPDDAATPGKTRTWWHPLLARLLEHELSPAFEVRDEVSVGTLPLEMVRDPETQPVLRYVFQQIRQFQQLGEAFMVQHTRTAEMDQEYAAFKEAFVRSLTPEDLALLLPEERLAGLAPEERLAGLSAEDVRRVFPIEDLFAVLTPEERRRLFERFCDEGYTPRGEESAG